MIKSKNGIVTLRGKKSDMYADLCMIIRALVMDGIMPLDNVHRLADMAPLIGTEADSREE